MLTRPLLARIILAAAFAVVMVVFAIGSAIVRAYVDTDLKVAASVWPNHPDVLASTSMLEVAQAAALAQPVPPKTWSHLATLSNLSPLAPEPFLVAGASALKERHNLLADQLLLAARRRDPRSAAARYLLSDLYLQQNRVGLALNELSALSRLLPELAAPLAPPLAKYAESAGAVPQLKRALNENPSLATGILAQLATDYRNTDLILALAGPQEVGAASPAWEQKLLSSLMAAGEYSRAYALWRRSAPPSEPTVDLSSFQRAVTPSPFTWALAQGNDGAAEPDQGGLHVTFSGAENVIFASRTALLPQGTYDMSMQIAGKTPAQGSVSWSVMCLPDNEQLATLDLSQARRLSARFQVGPQCSVQKIELKGVGQTYPENSEFSIRDFAIKRLSQ